MGAESPRDQSGESMQFRGIRIYEFGGDEKRNMVVHNADNPVLYTTDEIVRLGKGDFKKGVAEVSKRHYKPTAEKPQLPKDK